MTASSADLRVRRRPASRPARLRLYLDQNYLSGIAKGKPAFAGLEPLLRAGVRAGRLAIPESPAHALESAPRPDLGLLELLRSLSGVGERLPDPGARERALRRRLEEVLVREYPQRRDRPSDRVDLDVLSLVLPRCELVTCDAHMAAVVRRIGADALYGCELYSGRRDDVARLTERLRALVPPEG